MCGIFGYLGKKYDATKMVLRGLKRLEYRGYDSWGIGIKNSKGLKIEKHIGKISEAQSRLPHSSVAIGHTRWATHGAVTQTNAHPHFSSDKSFILAHNGIVENYQELKTSLIKTGFDFQTQTDTEVIVRLIEKKFQKIKDLTEALRLAFLELQGRNTIILLTKKGWLYGARKGSPLVIGLADEKKKEIYFSSDVLSFAPYVQKIIVLDNQQMAIAQPGKIKIINIKTKTKILPQLEKINFYHNQVTKDGYPHFMIKEIHETPFVIQRILKGDIKGYYRLAAAIKKARFIYTLGSGTAGVAAGQIAFYLRVLGRIPAVSLIGAEAEDYYPIFGSKDLIIAPSQSGETADVLEVLEEAKKKRVKIASFVNMPGSMMTRLSDFKFMAEAGPEICVMSTKVFVSQLSWGYLIAKIVQGKLKEGITNLRKLSLAAHKYLKTKTNHQKIKKLAKKLAKYEHIFLLSSYQNFQIIKEGMIKIIEGSYIHAHALPAGDLKHYAITLIDKDLPVILVISHDVVQKNIFNALNEVKARGGQIIGIASQKHKNFDTFVKVPDLGEVSAIFNIIPLQLLAYYLAVVRGNNVDRPRHIAKSVTVK